MPYKSCHRAVKVRTDYSEEPIKYSDIPYPKVKAWKEYYDELKAYYNEHGNTSPAKKDHGELHKWIWKQRDPKSELTSSQILLLNQLNFDWETYAIKIERIWNENLEILKQHKNKHGHVRLESYKGVNRTWLSAQRSLYRNGKLKPERIEKLQQIDDFFASISDKSAEDAPVPDKWSEDATAIYPSTNSAFWARLKSYEGINRPWVLKQQDLYRNGKLKPAQYEKLQQIDNFFSGMKNKSAGRPSCHRAVKMRVDYSETPLNDPYFYLPNPPKGKTWKNHYQELKAYYIKQGHSNPTKDHTGLYKWALKQRDPKSDLTGSQISLLNKLNFDWETREMRNERVWNENLEVVKKYKSKHGSVRFYEGVNRSWVGSQRRLYMNGKLKTERAEKLNEIDGFFWGISDKCTEDAPVKGHSSTNNDSSSDQSTEDALVKSHSSINDVFWERNYRILCEYKRQNRCAMVPKHYAAKGENGEKSIKLGLWLRSQRRMYHNGVLAENRTKKLRDIGFAFTIHDEDRELPGVVKRRRKLSPVEQVEEPDGDQKLASVPKRRKIDLVK